MHKKLMIGLIHLLTKLMQDSHMLLLLFSLMLTLQVPQLGMPKINKDFHILTEKVHTIQVLQQWTQMLQFGKELLFMIKRSMEKKINRSITITQIMHRKSVTGLTLIQRKLTQGYHMHLPLFNLMLTQLVPQLDMQKINKDFLILTDLVLTIQELQRWTQMLLFGKELQFMMEKSMERKPIVSGTSI